MKNRKKKILTAVILAVTAAVVIALMCVKTALDGNGRVLWLAIPCMVVGGVGGVAAVVLWRRKMKKDPAREREFQLGVKDERNAQILLKSQAAAPSAMLIVLAVLMVAFYLRGDFTGMYIIIAAYGVSMIVWGIAWLWYRGRM
jgi:anaerobic C4-dicarboxylate transporter